MLPARLGVRPGVLACVTASPPLGNAGLRPATPARPPPGEGPAGGPAGEGASPTSAAVAVADTTGIGSVRCRSASAGSQPAGRCHSSPASRHAPSACCHTDPPPAPVIASPIPEPSSARLRVPPAGPGPGSGWPSPAGPGQPGPAASIPPGYPRSAGVWPSAGTVPRRAHGETERLTPP